MGEMIGRGNKTKLIVTIVGVSFVAAVAAVALGNSDEGEIDVRATVQNANDVVRETGEGTIAPQIGRGSNAPNGGLIGTGKPDPIPEPIVDEAASSTDESASSSVDGSEEESNTDESSEEVSETEADATSN